MATAIVWLLIAPSEVLAWGPATHVAISEAVLASLHLLPPAVRVLLDRHRLPFLYGSMAADISFAKKYAAVGRHSHHWHIGQEILESADSKFLRAVALGYLSHLAADTIAHNFFVPRQLLLTSTSHAVGHTYWEHRMDVHLGKRFGGEARKIVLFNDHSKADELFDRVLSRTLFSFRTNRRIFRSMIAFQDDELWQQIFEEILRRSRFDLPREYRDLYIRLSYDFVMEFLADRARARAMSLDPIGTEHLRLAKVIQREVRFAPGGLDPEAIKSLAERHFALPPEPLIYVPRAPNGIAVPGLHRGDAVVSDGRAG